MNINGFLVLGSIVVYIDLYVCLSGVYFIKCELMNKMNVVFFE